MSEVFTVGYEALTPKTLVRLLRAAGVSRVVDVRELAISRRPGFAKTALAASLRNAGISYTHVPVLGCPREIRHAYREDLDWNRYARRYCSYLEKQDADVVALLHLVRGEHCCLLCYEADFTVCHRSLIADRLRLLSTAVRVTHLVNRVPNQSVSHLELVAA